MVRQSPQNQAAKRPTGHTTSVSRNPQATAAGLSRRFVPSPSSTSSRVNASSYTLTSPSPAVTAESPLSSELSQRRTVGGGPSRGKNSSSRSARVSATPAGVAHNGLMNAHEDQAVDPSNWSQVVLTVTSGLVFVFVGALFYTIFTLVRPYGKSIATSVFLSIVVHPQNRPLISLNVECCMDRMRRMQRSWSKFGSPFYIIGCWFSLVHFISFEIMQCVIFLGLDKMRILWPQWYKGCQQRTKPEDVSPCTEPLKGGNRKRLLSSTLNMDYDSQLENEVQPTLLVATKKGRMFLRCLTVCIVSLFFYSLLGIQYFVLLHVILLLTFAFFIPFIPPHAFIEDMTRIWKLALFTILFIGLFNNFTMDILTICDTVKRTTTSVVLSNNVKATASVASAVSSMNASHSHITGFVKTTGEEILPMNYASILSQSLSTANLSTVSPGSEKGIMNLINQSNMAISESDPVQLTEKHEVTESLSAAANRMFLKHRDTISDYVYRFAQSFLLQELGILFNQTNTTELEADLRLWVSLWSENFEAQFFVDNPEGDSVKGTATRISKSNHSVGINRVGWTWWRQIPFHLLYTLFGSSNPPSVSNSAFGNGSLGVPPDRLEEQGGGNYSKDFPPSLLSTVNWSVLLQLVTMRVVPLLEHSTKILVTLSANLLNLTDTIYSIVLFVLLFRYFAQLEHSLLYYAIVKVLVIEPRESREYRAHRIERDITVSFTTLLQSFWHLTWFHFAITFMMFKWWGLPTPFLCGIVAVLLVLFPLSPKWLNPCSIALLILVAQTIVEGGIIGALCDLRVLSFFAAVVLDSNDDWLLHVTQGPCRDPCTGAVKYESKQFTPFVVGTMIVLGFVAYGAVGILLGPLIAIIAKVFFDNWETELTNRPPLQPSVTLEPVNHLREKV